LRRSSAATRANPAPATVFGFELKAGLFQYLSNWLLLIKGLLLVLFIGFCRLNHFVNICEDPMLLGILGVMGGLRERACVPFLSGLLLNSTTLLTFLYSLSKVSIFSVRLSLFG
jgi:hypothetical protein